MQNPFEIFDKRLSNIESILLDLNNSQNKPVVRVEQDPTFNKIPVQEIFKQKVLSKPTFYQHVKDGAFTLYKLGGRSYVDAKEFDNAFKKVQMA